MPNPPTRPGWPSVVTGGAGLRVLDLDAQAVARVVELQRDVPEAVQHGVGHQLGDDELGVGGVLDPPGLAGAHDGVPRAADGRRLAGQRPPPTARAARALGGVGR